MHKKRHTRAFVLATGQDKRGYQSRQPGPGTDRDRPWSASDRCFWRGKRTPFGQVIVGAGQKTGLEIIQEPVAQRSRPPAALPILLNQPMPDSVTNRREYAIEWQAGPLFEIGFRKAVMQTEIIEHELENNVPVCQQLLASARFSVRFNIPPRIFRFEVATDPPRCPICQLSVGPGADTDIVAIGPVVEVVPTLPIWPGVGRNLIVPETGL